MSSLSLVVRSLRVPLAAGLAAPRTALAMNWTMRSLGLPHAKHQPWGAQRNFKTHQTTKVDPPGSKKEAQHESVTGAGHEKPIEASGGTVGQESNASDKGKVVSGSTADDQKTVVTTVPLPGLSKDDISIELHNNQLKISAWQSSSQTSNEGNYHIESSRYGYFERTVPVPPGVSKKDIKADLNKDGILRVEYPNIEHCDEVKKIEVKQHEHEQ